MENNRDFFVKIAHTDFLKILKCSKKSSKTFRIALYLLFEKGNHFTNKDLVEMVGGISTRSISIAKKELTKTGIFSFPANETGIARCVIARQSPSKSFLLLHTSILEEIKTIKNESELRLFMLTLWKVNGFTIGRETGVAKISNSYAEKVLLMSPKTYRKNRSQLVAKNLIRVAKVVGLKGENCSSELAVNESMILKLQTNDPLKLFPKGSKENTHNETLLKNKDSLVETHLSETKKNRYEQKNRKNLLNQLKEIPELKPSSNDDLEKIINEMVLEVLKHGDIKGLQLKIKPLFYLQLVNSYGSIAQRIFARLQDRKKETREQMKRVGNDALFTLSLQKDLFKEFLKENGYSIEGLSQKNSDELKTIQNELIEKLPRIENIKLSPGTSILYDFVCEERRSQRKVEPQKIVEIEKIQEKFNFIELLKELGVEDRAFRVTKPIEVGSIRFSLNG